jgi:Tfp pilus assembly protein PilW
MIGLISRRLRAGSGEAGMTLVELLVASTLSVIVLGGLGAVLVGALRAQPGIGQKAADVQTARFVMERMTRELREGVVVDKASGSSISFQTYVRHATCGGSAPLASTLPSIKCEVTYTCASGSCTRLESAPNVYSGTAVRIFKGLSNSSSVFTYSPSSTNPTFVGVTITIPAAASSAVTTIFDGASLRNATLGN